MGDRQTQRQSNTQTLNAESAANIRQGQSNIRGMLNSNPFQQYDGDLVAGLNDNQLAARDMFANGMGAGNPLLSEAATAARSAGGYAPETITPQSFADADLSAYQNPFQQEVIDAAANDINRQRELMLNDNSARATKSGAWGGSRHGVIDAETNRAAGDTLARTTAQLRSQGFDRAAELFGQDASRQMQADMANNQFGLAGQNLNLQGAGLLGQLGQYENDNLRANTSLLAGLGSEENQLETAGNLADYGEYLRRYEDMYRRVGAEGMATGLMPALVNSQGTATTQNNPGLLSIAGTGAQMASLFMSDRRLKTDISPVGEHKGRKWYEFRYIWDKPAVRRLGLMAQDLIKTEPERVVVMPNGYMAVDYEGAF